MKIIFLNVWNAKVGEPFVNYVKEQAKDTDVFCFQEAYDETKLLLQDVLSEYEMFSAFKFITEKDEFPQVIYVKKGIEVVSSGEVLDDFPECGLAKYVQLKINNQDIYVCNFHGISRPVEKLDTTERIQQSQELMRFFKNEDAQIVIGGDFNLFPIKKSVMIFEENSYRDLIKDYKVETTRNRLAWDRYPEHKYYFSDYVFVSKNVSVKDFAVHKNEVSDHLPLILEIE